MIKDRSSGVLLHISSTPSPFGVGVLGNECKKFIDKLSNSNFKWWQILPININDSANSPYCSVSALAGNYLYIDPREIPNLTENDINDNIYFGSEYTAAYEFAKTKRLDILKKSYKKIDDNTKPKIEKFVKENAWIDDFALFMAVKDKFNDKPWWEWDSEYSNYSACINHKNEFIDEINFWIYTQYIFFKQYNEIKEYANSKNIKIIGDIPIYVAMDSVDVWSNISQFQIDKKTLSPTKVAGVPPDYFSKDGQLWGNPLYDWEQMKKNNFAWWKKRLSHSLKIFDNVRIDHFRAFASYWAVPADAETAKIGEWISGPKMEFFDEINKEFDNPNIIAEDLGLFGEDVVKLLDDTKLPGMRVIQFGFDTNGDSTHLPHNYEKNSIAYVGTHDNNTILGWLWEAGESEREFALEYCGFEGTNWGDGGYYSPSCRKVIETVWKSSSGISIIAVQDMCGFGSDARMNIPGVPKENWRYRATQEVLNSIDWNYFKKINHIFRRG